MQQFQEIVTLEAASTEPSKVIDATQNFRCQVEFYPNKSAGHFEADIKKIKMLGFLC